VRPSCTPCCFSQRYSLTTLGEDIRKRLPTRGSIQLGERIGLVQPPRWTGLRAPARNLEAAGAKLGKLGDRRDVSELDEMP